MVTGARVAGEGVAEAWLSGADACWAWAAKQTQVTARAKVVRRRCTVASSRLMPTRSHNASAAPVRASRGSRCMLPGLWAACCQAPGQQVTGGQAQHQQGAKGQLFAVAPGLEGWRHQAADAERRHQQAHTGHGGP